MSASAITSQPFLFNVADKKAKITETGQFMNKINRFSYFSDAKWQPLPRWACFYLELGAVLSNYESNERRFVVAITIPIRDFASSLISSGFIVSKAELSNQRVQAQISKLEALPIGTPVTFRKNNLQYYGIYQGAFQADGKQYFRIAYQQGGEIYFPYEDYYKIELSEKHKRHLPNIQSGRQLDQPSPLLKNLFEGEVLNRFLIESKLECVILGQQKSLRQELCNFLIGYRNMEDQMMSGMMVDLVRARGSQFQLSNRSYRSYVLPSSGKYNQQFTAKLNNHVTIFDNPLSFLKWRHCFTHSNWLVVLDKTERNFDLALKEINDEYINNRVEHQQQLRLPKPPPGVDIMVFEVGI
jgi:hypothetical protein